MLKRFLPPQADFFHLFQEVAKELLQAVEALHQLIEHLDNTAPWLEKVTQHEAKADAITHATYDLLHKTFITPFDRHDIHSFIGRLDDIVDATHHTAQRLFLYKIKALPKALESMVGICKEIAVKLLPAISGLDHLKNKQDIIEICKAVNRLADQGEQYFLEGMAEIFEKEEDIKLLLKMKEIYEDTKLILDAAQDFSNLMKGIILEYS
ncbi:MAG: DUF47 domain-containing protein [Gammaproteobacteria bacterium]